MYERILCATDLSESSRASVEKAQQIAKVFEAELYLLHVIEAMHAYGPGGMVIIDEKNYLDAAWNAINNFAQPFGIAETHLFIKVGPRKRNILKTSEKLAIDLIVVGSHSKSGFSRLLGSTAHAVLYSSDRDVLCIQPS